MTDIFWKNWRQKYSIDEHEDVTFKFDNETCRRRQKRIQTYINLNHEDMYQLKKCEHKYSENWVKAFQRMS